MIPLLIGLLIFALLVWLGYYIIGKMGMPEPTALVVRVVFGVICLLILLQEFMHPFGGYYIRY